jgi:organic hydroperoxide reductase OsmC/OhrA
MPHFPIEYEVSLQRSPSGSMELHAGDRPTLTIGPPPDFGGSDTWWSPEHLLVSAAAACFATTFFAAAKRGGLLVGELRCRATGVLARTSDAIAFTSIDLAVHVHVASDDVDRTRRMLDETKERCFVARSLRCPVSLSVEVSRS